jgi:hypothetical protein
MLNLLYPRRNLDHHGKVTSAIAIAVAIQSRRFIRRRTAGEAQSWPG